MWHCCCSPLPVNGQISHPLGCDNQGDFSKLVAFPVSHSSTLPARTMEPNLYAWHKNRNKPDTLPITRHCEATFYFGANCKKQPCRVNCQLDCSQLLRSNMPVQHVEKRNISSAIPNICLFSLTDGLLRRVCTLLRLSTAPPHTRPSTCPECRPNPGWTSALPLVLYSSWPMTCHMY